MVSSLQKSMINLAQVLRLREHQKSFKELEKLGAIDVYYLEAIYQLKEPTIGTISKLLGQSTPNTNYHIKKLINLGLIEKRIDDVDRRVTHLLVTDKYSELINSDEDFWPGCKTGWKVKWLQPTWLFSNGFYDKQLKLLGKKIVRIQ